MADARDLTDGERLFIWRRRNNARQDWAAEQLDISLSLYLDYEHERLPLRGAAARLMHAARLHTISTAEACVIARRRANLTIPDVAATMGRSRWWVNRMELGKAPVAELASFWGV